MKSLIKGNAAYAAANAVIAARAACDVTEANVAVASAACKRAVREFNNAVVAARVTAAIYDAMVVYNSKFTQRRK